MPRYWNVAIYQLIISATIILHVLLFKKLFQCPKSLHIHDLHHLPMNTEQTQQNPPSPTSPMSLSSLSKMPTATVIFISSHLASSRVLVGCPKFHVIGPGGFHVAKDFTVGPGGLRVQPVVAVASVANFNPGPI